MFALSLCMYVPVPWQRKSTAPELPPREPMTLATARQWLATRRHNPEAKHRLLCFAWSGALPAIFSAWTIPGVEIIVVQLPGRHP